ncbi:hypothetical protein tloyanaT_18740 [Thalassotalea loyana]|uniref:DUF2066 domain-containing protein n=1 Tax=Thalassotalea loyana TaxID=280483 RepID=A0ABQ6HFW8_9GAMM|nr:DUF2066 domain-containing protein [Thalassotalea loyana]GLX85622.1 hypothetical protein tloyanaT_18740 [Thalassotalea loyana]
MQPIRIDNMAKSLVLTIILLINCFCFSVKAVEVTELYTGKIEVQGQSRADRDTGLQQALEQVMLKVGGNNDFASNPQISTALKSPSRYVAQFYYDRVDQQTLLVAEFDENKVNQLFYDAQLPILGNIRPLLTVWLVEEHGLARNIINHSSDNVLAQKVKAFSEQRAVPMVLPLMDLEDISRVQVSDIWGRFEEPVKVASERYLAEASVIIRISDNTLVEAGISESQNCELPCQQSLYALDWSIVEDYQQFGSRIQGSNPELLVEEALTAISQHIHQQYALSMNTQNIVTIEVANVDSMSTYVAVSQFLADFSAVSDVKLRYAQGSVRRFDVSLLGSRQAFMASIELVDELKQIIDPLAQIDEQATPVFYWQE